MESNNLASAFSDCSISKKRRPVLKHPYVTFPWENKPSIWCQVRSRFLHPQSGSKPLSQELIPILVMKFFCTHRAPASTKSSSQKMPNAQA